MNNDEIKAVADIVRQHFLDQTGCWANPDTVKEHTTAIATIQINLQHILEGQKRIEDVMTKRFDNGNDQFKSIETRLTTIETEKKSQSSTIATIGAGIALFISAIPYIGKIFKQ